MTVLIDDGSGGVRLLEPTRLERVRARLAARRLDRALANGASPDSDVLIALHARRLTGMRERSALADGLMHAWLAATSPRALSAAVIDVGAVSGALPELVALRETLLAPGPVSVRGVAAVRCLLVNGTGPMYGGSPGRPLGAALRHAAELLRVMPVAVA